LSKVERCSFFGAGRPSRVILRKYPNGQISGRISQRSACARPIGTGAHPASRRDNSAGSQRPARSTQWHCPRGNHVTIDILAGADLDSDDEKIGAQFVCWARVPADRRSTVTRKSREHPATAPPPELVGAWLFLGLGEVSLSNYIVGGERRNVVAEQLLHLSSFEASNPEVAAPLKGAVVEPSDRADPNIGRRGPIHRHEACIELCPDFRPSG
jgi:hypothetical protein